MVLCELELGVLRTDSQCIVNGLQLLLAILGSDCTTGFCQQVLTGEGAAWLGIIPCAIEFTLLHLDTADDQSQQAVNGVLRSQHAQDAAQHIAQRTAAGGAVITCAQTAQTTEQSSVTSRTQQHQ